MIKFSDIVGHDNVKEHLQSAMEQGKISHAYIFCGEKGSGKKMMAECFAAALMCNGEGEKPCGACISCMQTESHNHPDVVYVTHEKTRIGVDEIRVQLLNDIAIKPFSSEKKIYIIDEAEKMTEQAQNALLKTLEEPPEYAVIVLLATNTGSFLQTIMSRCVTLQFKPLDNQLIIDYLMKRMQIPDYLAKVCASFSGGYMGKALNYVDNSDFVRIKDDSIRLMKLIDTFSQSDIMEEVGALVEQKEHLDDYLDLMQMWFRDVMIYKATQNPNRLTFSEEISDIRRQASEYGYESLGKITESFVQVRERIKANVNLEVALEMLMLDLRNK